MKVLVLTGGLVSGAESSVFTSLRKLYTQWRASEHSWLDTKIKLAFAELLWRKPRPSGDDLGAPDLTEVVLATLLRQAGMDYVLATYDDLFRRPRRVEALLAETECVFLSTTFLRDLSELMPLVRIVKRPHNRIVVGGPLAQLLAGRWEVAPEIDLLAAGYGEYLVPRLVEWMRAGFPDDGRVMISGVPPTASLDFLPTPDWAQSQRDHQRQYRMIYYESVRGCPYRCNFCNYPYLFNDTKFRYKSAGRMADEWAQYVSELGIEYITCLDSLFTVPRARLTEFCHLLMERRIRVKWNCYARADDLADEATTVLMKRAGVDHVQIGLESGVQSQLDNMDKACTVEANARAIDLCRKHGVTTVVSLIAGFPGETKETVGQTLDFLRAHPPDFFFVAPFSTRATGVPLLSAANRQRFELGTTDNLRSGAPYWRHATMTCTEMGNQLRRMHRAIVQEEISLHGALNYHRLFDYRAEERAALLDEQRRLTRNPRLLEWAFDAAHRLVDARLARDVDRCIPPTDLVTLA